MYTHIIIAWVHQNRVDAEGSLLLLRMAPTERPIATLSENVLLVSSIELRLVSGYLQLIVCSHSSEILPWQAPHAILVQAISSSTVSAHAWTHVCGRWSTTAGLEVYNNGRQMGSSRSRPCGPTISQTTGHVIIPSRLDDKLVRLHASPLEAVDFMV